MVQELTGTVVNRWGGWWIGMFAESLLHRFRDDLQRFAEEGDEDAYERLGQALVQVRDQLRHDAIQRGVPDADADDVVQEALRRAVAKDSLLALWQRYGEAADAGIYLRMELRGAISDYRKKHRLPADSLEQLWEGGRDISVSPQPPRLDSSERQMLWQTIRECLGNEVDAQILWLRVECRLDGKQVAEMLCMSHENVRQRFCYAIEKLQHHEAFCRVCRQLELLDGGE